MFNLFSSLSKNDNTTHNHYTGSTITFDQLLAKITSINQIVESARQYGKGSPEYDELKTKHIECIFANGYTKTNTRSTKGYFKSTGYIYLDFDLTSSESALQLKSEIIQHKFIAAAWLSISGKGLSVLVKVNPDRCNKYQYNQYWSKLNQLFNGDLDEKTKDFYRLVCISSDTEAYINKNAIEFDTLYPIDYTDGLNYSTPIPLEQFESVNKPVVYPDGLDTIQLDFYKYRSNKVSTGNRTATIGAISMQLIHLNPTATKKQLLNALASFNHNYCKAPLSEKEIGNILSANLKKPVLDINKYTKKKYVFFHPQCRMPKPYKDKIRGEEMSKLKSVLVNDAVDNIINVVKPSKVTIEMIAEYTDLSKSGIYMYLSFESKTKIKKYNENDTFSKSHIYTLSGYNMQQMEKVSSTQLKVYEALEELQDNQQKLNQQKASDYTGLSLPTVKRNWHDSFKWLVKDYNDSLKEIPTAEENDPENDYVRTRDLLSSLPSDQDYDKYIQQIRTSIFYK